MKLAEDPSPVFSREKLEVLTQCRLEEILSRPIVLRAMRNLSRELINQ